MSQVILYQNRASVESVFELLGYKENDLTASLAWVLAKSPRLLNGLLKRLVGVTPTNGNVEIRIQRTERDGGITDIEVVGGDDFLIVIEAKRGWNLPKPRQLELYARRQSFRESPAKTKAIAVLSECSREYTAYALGSATNSGVPLRAIAWQEVLDLVDAKHIRSVAERYLLRQFTSYLRSAITMQDPNSNLVYVVALGAGKHVGWGISWMDIVTKRKRYFHPVGRVGWPKEPPNYIAFRYGGQLRSIHHIDGYEITTNLNRHFPEIPDDDREPHFVYKLGPAFTPSRVMRTGKVYPNGRVWCMLDTLFTCDTISAARDLTKRRQANIPE